MDIWAGINITHNRLGGCYSTDLKELCNRFFSPEGYGYPNDYAISAGNNFSASWLDFCIFNDGICPACPSNISNLVIDNSTPFQNLFQVSSSITNTGIVEINNGEQVEYIASDITLNEGFNAKVGCNFTIISEICDQ